MAIDWSLAAKPYDALEVLRTFGTAQQDRLKQEQLARQRQAGGMLAQGDFRGARNTALAAGDFDLAGTVSKFDQQQRDVTKAHAKEVGEAIKWADTPEKWDQAVTALSSRNPEIAQYAGRFDQREQLAIQLGQVSQLLDDDDAYTLNPGDRRYQGGKMVAENPAALKYESVPAGGMLVPIGPNGPMTGFDPGDSAPAAGGTRTAPSSPGSASVPFSGGQIEEVAFSAVPGARVTSAQRTPAHNREVGGAPNSYHLTGEARDLVPPAGIGMSQFAENLRQVLPGMDVINERDHVHVEPGSRRSGSQRPGIIMGPRKPQYQLIGAREARQIGLDPAGTYQRSPDGQISAVREPKSGEEPASRRRELVAARKDFDGQPEVKAFREVRPAFRQIESLVKKGNLNPQEDTALVYSFMKMAAADGSVIREGEFALVGNGASYSERVNRSLVQFQQGNSLTPRLRKDVLEAARTIYLSRRQTYNEVAERFQGYARQQGVNPKAVAPRAIPGPPIQPNGGASPARGRAITPTIRRIG